MSFLPSEGAATCLRVVHVAQELLELHWQLMRVEDVAVGVGVVYEAQKIQIH